MWVDPVVFQLGFLQVRWYGIVYGFGILLLYFFLNFFRRDIGLTKELIDRFIFYLMIGMLIGARILHFLFSEPKIFIVDPLEIFKIWHGGMSFFGGLVGILITGYIFCKKYNKKLFLLSDFVVLPVALTLVFGRIANYINNELIGTITDVSWCVNFPTAEGCRHPYPIYASISHLILFLILLALFWYKNNNRNKFRHGTIFLSFTFIYSILRFITDFFRQDYRVFGITSWQTLSIITAIISMIFLIHLYREDIFRK